MRTSLVTGLAFALVFVGCSSDDSSESTADDTRPVGSPDPAVAAGAVQTYVDIELVGVGDDSFVELTNFTDVPVEVGGLHLCQGSDCDELPAALVDPGEAFYVVVDGDPEVDGPVLLDNADIGQLRPGDGELALFSRPDFDDPRAIVLYMEWGFAPHPTTELAIDAGLWVDGAFAPTVPNAVELFRQDSGLWLFREE